MRENKQDKILYERPRRGAVGEKVAYEAVQDEKPGCCWRWREVRWTEAVEEDEDEEGGEMNEEGHFGFVWRVGFMVSLVLRVLVYLYLCLLMYLCIRYVFCW